MPGSNMVCHRLLQALLLLAIVMSAGGARAVTDSARRVPAEWEPQKAIWLQWPGRREKSHETAFARMANVIVRYETLHILHASTRIMADARRAIAREGGDPDHANIVWHALEKYFPERDVHVIEMLDSWLSGGGVHCHTNDQPALPMTVGSESP